MASTNTDSDAHPQGRSSSVSASDMHANLEYGLGVDFAAARLAADGPNDIPERKSHPLLVFASKFWGLSAWMIELIALLSWVLGKWTDLWIALALLVVNAVLSFLQQRRASTAVAALRSRLQVTARVLRGGLWHSVPARELVVGDVIRVRTGDFVPADASIAAGTLQVDQSALTGESQEVSRADRDGLYSGTVVRSGEATGVVTATGVRTYFGRTTHLVESAHPQLHVEEVISRVVKWLFVIVGVLVALTTTVSLIQHIPLVEVVPLSLVLLMSAIPIALPVMFTVTMALGSVELARHGVLVTRLSAAEDAANMQVLCADKTGTLTLNRLSLAGVLPQPGFSEDDVVRAAALASYNANQDSIDLSFLRAAQERQLAIDTVQRIAFTPFSAATRRTEAVVREDTRHVRIVKGALRTVAQLAAVDDAALAVLERQATDAAIKGFRTLAVARDDTHGQLRLIGIAMLYDAPRTDSRQLIQELKALGIDVKMLTGDALPVARAVATELQLGEIIRATELHNGQDTPSAATDQLLREARGFAEVFPEDKFLVVSRLQHMGNVVGMTGDGVNDAPALRQAEVGIAVSGATDVAKAAASVVLTAEGLQGIVELVKGGRAIYQRVLTWIINKVSRTILKSGFVVIAFLVTGKFVISALGMMLLVFMTDFVKIALATDSVRPSQQPETWNIGPQVKLAVALGIVMLIEALLLLAFGWQHFNLSHHPRQLQTFAFQTLLFFALFSLVSIRERRAFWRSRPSTVLAVALIADAIASALIGLIGVGDLRALPFTVTALIIACSMFLSLIINDPLKCWLIKRWVVPVSIPSHATH